MEMVLEKGMDDLAKVYAARYRGRDDLVLEFVDSLSGCSSIDEKWVLVISSQFGCPVGCLMCDTAGYYRGNPTADEIFSQVDHIVRKRFPDGNITTGKFKVQFARMGEPALNPEVLGTIEMIMDSYDCPGFMPCISTTAPLGCDDFFEGLIDLNKKHFRGNFQLQFSVHSTCEKERDRIIPFDKWDMERISEYGNRFHVGGRKVALNFAVGPDNEIDTNKLSDVFDPDAFMFKFTPVNPTAQARMNRLVRDDLAENDIPQIAELRALGFDVVLSIGDLRENEIGSNCGQLAALWRSGSSDSLHSTSGSVAN